MKYLSMLLLGFTGLCLLCVPAAIAQTEGFPEDLYQEISRSCMGEMASKIVSPQIAKAYCYCYTEKLSTVMTEDDMNRIGEYGVSENDSRRFKEAHRSCVPEGRKKKGLLNFSFWH